MTESPVQTSDTQLIELARFNMIEQQIRPWDVLDPRVLDLLNEVPREDYVPEEHRELAFADIMIPLQSGAAGGDVMLQPRLEARLIQSLSVQPTDTILEIGTGSGYMTALLSRLGYFVHSIDINPVFTRSAAAKLDRDGITNVTLETGDGCQGWAQNAPYDAILFTGSVASLNDDIRQQLKPGGRLVAVVGQDPIMETMLYSCTSEQGWESQSLFDTSIPALVNANATPAFIF